MDVLSHPDERGIHLVPSLESCLETSRRLQYELERTRRAADESRQRLFDFLATVSDLIWETDVDLRIVATQLPRDVVTTADDNELLLGKTIVQMARGTNGSDPLYLAHLEDLRAQRPFRNFVCSIPQPDGGLLWFESNGNPFFGKDGDFQGYRGTARHITARKEQEARVAFLACHDALTSLPNRVTFQERLEQALALAAPGAGVALLCLDLDGFKSINDTLGHPVGDSLLRAVAGRLEKCVQGAGTVARLGGDEFAIVRGGLTNPETEAKSLADQILEAIREPFEIDGYCAVVEVTVGIALAPGPEITAGQLLKNADIALCRAKLDEPGTCRCFDFELGERFEARRLLEVELRAALGNDEFELVYQPFHNVQTGKVCAFEALLRWRHPRRGLVLPDEFIPLAEETALIVPIGEWVLRQACAEAAHWPAYINLAVNLSPVQFRSRNLVPAVIQALSASGLPGHRLELEITEAVLMQSNDQTLTALRQLRGLGAQISLDDFGTGYCSFAYIRTFPFDKIKIARSFIRELAEAQGAMAIVRAIAGLGTSLQVATTAEGVETQEQFAILQAEGCTEVQGYLFSTPKPAADFPLLQEMRRESVTKPEPPFNGLPVDITGNRYVLDSQSV